MTFIHLCMKLTLWSPLGFYLNSTRFLKFFLTYFLPNMITESIFWRSSERRNMGVNRFKNHANKIINNHEVNVLVVRIWVSSMTAICLSQDPDWSQFHLVDRGFFYVNCSCRPMKHQCIPKNPLARKRSTDRGSLWMLILLVHLRCSGPDFVLGHELERGISLVAPGKDFCFHFEIDLQCSLGKAVFGKAYLSLKAK